MLTERGVRAVSLTSRPDASFSVRSNLKGLLRNSKDGMFGDVSEVSKRLLLYKITYFAC